MTINRRSVLKSGLATAALVPLTITRAHADRKLTAVIYFTPTYRGIFASAQGFVKQFNDAAKGEAHIELFDSGQLVKADEQLPALRSGNIDLMFHATSYVTRTLPILGIVGLPGLVKDLYEHPERLAMGSPLLALIDEQLAKQNIYMPTLGGGILEPEYIWTRKGVDITSLAELKGRKIRIASYEATQAMEKLGVASVRLTSSEIYLALQRGTVDAAVANVETVVGRSLLEQIGSCYKLPVTAYTVAPFMLLNTWQALSAVEKSAIATASRWYDAHLFSMSSKEVYPNDYWKVVNGANIKVVDPTREDLQRFNGISQSVWDAWSADVGKEVGQRAIALARGEG